MNFKHLGVAVAIATSVSVPAFAQSGSSSVSSGTGVAVTSGTGIAVAPAAPLAPAASPRIIPGSAVVPHHTTTVMGGPAPGITSSTTTITYSWVNVPANASSRGDFQRWQSLK